MEAISEYFHSVRLIAERCKGCVNCIKHCPTEAIRIRGGKARITESRCIDCGECIRRCPNHAKTAVTDCLEHIKEYPFNVALPAPSLYGQFSSDISIEKILESLLHLGFDAVFEVALGADLVSRAIAEYLKRPDIKRPAISSACPAVVRLVQVQFPELIDHLIPIDAPVEVSARIARAEAAKQTGLAPENIGVWFITPCPAKVTTVKQPLRSEKSDISGAIGISKIYGDLLKVLPDCNGSQSLRRASPAGIGWALSGGEVSAVRAVNALIVNEIESVNAVLEQVALGKLKEVEYIECLSCAGGCIGGPLTVESRFVAQHRMQQRDDAKVEPAAGENLPASMDYHAVLGGDEHRVIEPRPAMRLDEDISRALYKVEVMEATLKRLPGLDCGSCGSPNCKALAEDIAQGTATETDCLFKLREKVRDLAREMVEVADKLPPPLIKQSDDES